MDRPADHLPGRPHQPQVRPRLRPQDRACVLEHRELQRGHGDTAGAKVRRI